MSGDRIDQLVAAYRDQLRLPWSRTIAGPQRIWMVVYDPELERRLRLKLEEFAIETREAGHAWELIDLTASFAEWLAANEYRDGDCDAGDGHRAGKGVADRWEFRGRIADEHIRSRYRHRSVKDYLPRGSQAPIVYVNC